MKVEIDLAGMPPALQAGLCALFEALRQTWPAPQEAPAPPPVLPRPAPPSAGGPAAHHDVLSPCPRGDLAPRASGRFIGGRDLRAPQPGWECPAAPERDGPRRPAAARGSWPLYQCRRVGSRGSPSAAPAFPSKGVSDD
jgi:hypothetical protein